MASTGDVFRRAIHIEPCVQAHGDAAAELEAAQSIYTARLGASCTLLPAVHTAYARNAAAGGEQRHTDSAYATALSAARAAHGAGSYYEAAVLVDWASAMHARGPERERALKWALHLMAATLHKHHPYVIHTATLLAQAHLAADKCSEAASLKRHFGLAQPG